MTSARLLLIGLMGTGKSTVGRILAERTGWRYVDNDDLVARAAGSNLEALRRGAGGSALHAYESQALLEVLTMEPPLVAGVAAHAATLPPNHDAIRRAGACVVWLRARPETLVERIGEDSERPWLQPDPLAVLRRMSLERSEIYAALSDMTVDVDDRTPEQAAQAVLSQLPG